MPNVAFNICCPRDCVSRHNGGTSGAPLKDDSVLRTLSSLRGLRGTPEVPPLCRETSVSRTANVGTDNNKPYLLHTQKNVLNLTKLNRIWIAIKLFRLIWHLTDYQINLKTVNNKHRWRNALKKRGNITQYEKSFYFNSKKGALHKKTVGGAPKKGRNHGLLKLI